METGDVLVMLTDGFFEWQRPLDGEAFGIERLSGCVRAAVRHNAAAMIQSIDTAVLEFADGIKATRRHDRGGHQADGEWFARRACPWCWALNAEVSEICTGVSQPSYDAVDPTRGDGVML